MIYLLLYCKTIGLDAKRDERDVVEILLRTTTKSYDDVRTVIYRLNMLLPYHIRVMHALITLSYQLRVDEMVARMNIILRYLRSG